MLKTVLRTASALGAVVYAGAVNASAGCLLGLICLGGGDGGGDPPPGASVPEIDATQGLAAVAVLLCVALLLRERFLRARR